MEERDLSGKKTNVMCEAGEGVAIIHLGKPVSPTLFPNHSRAQIYKIRNLSKYCFVSFFVECSFQKWWRFRFATKRRT